MHRNSHGLRPENLREDSYFAEIDQILLQNLRETLELRREAEQCASGDRRDNSCSDQTQPDAYNSRRSEYQRV